MAELFFGDFRFDTRRLSLEGSDGIAEVRPRTLELLTYLIEHRNRFVPRDELMTALWQGVTVTPSSLTQCVSELRQALGDSAHDSRYVETRVKLGYRFVATVYHRPTERLEPLPPPAGLAAPAGSPRVAWRAPLVLVCCLLLAVTAAGIAWWAMRPPPEAAPTAVVVPPVRTVMLSTTQQRAVEDLRHRLLERLAGLEGTSLSGELPTAVSAVGISAELSCTGRDDGGLELAAVVRRLPAGGAEWGWTWVIADGGEQLPLEIVERIAVAVESRAAVRPG